MLGNASKGEGRNEEREVRVKKLSHAHNAVNSTCFELFNMCIHSNVAKLSKIFFLIMKLKCQ